MSNVGIKARIILINKGLESNMREEMTSCFTGKNDMKFKPYFTSSLS
jgi:hypothetical protein